MKKKRSSGAVVFLIVAIVLIVALVAGRAYRPSVVKGILFVVGIVVVAFLALTAVVMYFAFKGSAEDARKAQEKKGDKAITPEQDQILRKGRENMATLKSMIMRVRNTDVREAGNEISVVMEKILTTLREKPKKISSVRQFFNYYLPTLGDVTKRYISVEKSGVPAAESTDKVLAYLKDVKTAMEKQYNNLFEEDVLNMEVDMEAMTMAIKREGLLAESAQMKAEPDEDKDDEIDLIL